MKELELYIHIPFCIKKCLYCDFLSFPCNEETQEAYVQALVREIRYYGARCGDYQVSTVYIGGGTPSWLRENLMAQILQAVRLSFQIAADAEISIECNPGTITAQKFADYRQMGINRLSIGLQSANDDELKLLGRIHTYDQFLKTYELARKSGFDNINIDLMNSLPGQTAEVLFHSLQQVIRLKPEHISAYSLIIEKGTPFYDKYKFDAVKQQAGMKTVALPSEDEVYQMTKMTEQVLKEAGYMQYEISNFARPGFACRHNIGYWKRVSYLGLGLGAASLMENVRYTNTRELYDYIAGTKLPDMEQQLRIQAEEIARKGQMEEFMFLGLRMTEGISRGEFEQAFGVGIEAVYGDVINRLQGEELLIKRAGRIFLTERGLDLSNYVLAQFLF
jgi:oxygen-independent coproporphyrinogen-3 oxidase